MPMGKASNIKEPVMATTVDSAAFDRGTDPILDFFSVDQARADGVPGR